jgi:hypothetical protein
VPVRNGAGCIENTEEFDLNAGRADVCEWKLMPGKEKFAGVVTGGGFIVQGRPVSGMPPLIKGLLTFPAQF